MKHDDKCLCLQCDLGRQMPASARQVAGSHYLGVKIQPVEYIHKNGIGFIEGNVIKYVTRHRAKGKADDIRKAIHFLQLLLELEYGQKEEATNELR